jgi:hypothetical protein
MGLVPLAKRGEPHGGGQRVNFARAAGIREKVLGYPLT